MDLLNYLDDVKLKATFFAVGSRVSVRSFRSFIFSFHPSCWRSMIP